MTPSTRRQRRSTGTALTALAPAALTGVVGCALAAAMLLSPTATPSDFRPVAACAVHSSGLAKDVQVKVTKAKAVSVKRLEVRKDTVKVRVKLAVTGIGTAAGYGYADACPGGVSNPQEINQTVTWKGTKAVRTDYTASGRTTKQATRIAVREASRLSRAAAIEDIAEATVIKTEAVARDLAVAASAGTPPPAQPGSAPDRGQR